MELGTKIGVVTCAVLLVLACSLAVAWQSVRKEQAQLQQKLNAAEEQVREADARQESRKDDLDKAMAQLAAQKKKVQTPKQVIDALPSVLPLPTAIKMNYLLPAVPSDGGKEGSRSGSAEVGLPIEDLKPVYDFALGCKACQAELAAARNDLKDEQVKTAALSRERDNALQAARGGSVLQRVLRAAKWFAIGAAAGAAAAKLAH